MLYLIHKNRTSQIKPALRYKTIQVTEYSSLFHCMGVWINKVQNTLLGIVYVSCCNKGSDMIANHEWQDSGVKNQVTWYFI